MKTLVITDLHNNPLRQAGTTMESRAALEAWQFERLKHVLQVPHDRVVVVGDLLHKNSVSEKTMQQLFHLFKDETVYLIRGNHDENSERYNEICSLQLLADILPKATLVFDEPLLVDDMYMIPHTFNQEQFDKFVESTPENVWVFIHANNNNNFAVESDHSLNLSREQRKLLIAKGCHILLGHEHAAKEKPNFTILGCLMPTSVADCLSGNKYYYIIEDDKLSKYLAWAAEDFIEMSWQDIADTDHKFVRVGGECDLIELPDIIRKIADLRKRSSAFVIANAVKPRVVEKRDITVEVTAFNIIELLLEQITGEFSEDVKSCV